MDTRCKGVRRGPRKARRHGSSSPLLPWLCAHRQPMPRSPHPLWAEAQPACPSPASEAHRCACLGACSTVCHAHLGARTTPHSPRHPEGTQHPQHACPRQQQLSARSGHLCATTPLGTAPLPCPQLASSSTLRCLSPLPPQPSHPLRSTPLLSSPSWDDESAPLPVLCRSGGPPSTSPPTSSSTC